MSDRADVIVIGGGIVGTSSVVFFAAQTTFGDSA